ncbi:MAG: hypothetical protein ABH823_05825 [bacterium]
MSNGGVPMHTSECTVIEELPNVIDLMSEDQRKKLDEIGSQHAAQRELHYEGYIAFTDTPYSVNQAKVTLFFD